MPVAVTMIGTDVTNVSGAGPVGVRADVEDAAAELVAHEDVLRQVRRRAAEVGRALDPRRHLHHRRGVVDVVQVAAADPARGDLDEHLPLPRRGLVDVVADEHRPVAQHG